MNTKNMALGLIAFVFITFIGVLLLTTSLKPKAEKKEEISTAKTSQIFNTVSPSDFSNEIKKEGVVLLDIRTKQEYDSGRIAGSVNLDFYNPDFPKQLGEMDKTKEYKIYCNSGNRSSSTMKMMRELGFTNVVELQGGITAWYSNKLDICTSC